MEIREYMLMQFNDLKRGTDRVLAGLNQHEIGWRPSCGCNSIGLILFHVIKGEDFFIQEIIQGKKTLWEVEKWYEKLGMPITEAGNGYNCEQVNNFSVPQLINLLAFAEAAHAKSVEYIKNLKLDDLDLKIKLPWGDFTVAGVISMVVTHGTQHIGEVSYLRGLQRGLDK
jgi:uncharacterized damage-inducible protein DinB